MKDFANARIYAEKSIENANYTDSNKYANYLSALMCQGKFWKACKYFYCDVKDKAAVRKILKRDWGHDSEMESIGLDVHRFSTMFALFDLLK